jgi:hypothetical protein
MTPDAPLGSSIPMNIQLAAVRYAHVPMADWRDHCQSGRYGEAIQAIQTDRLRASVGISLEVAAEETGATLEQVRAAVDWNTYQQYLDQVGAAVANCHSIADVQSAGAIFQQGAEFFGQYVATTPIGQAVVGLASLGAEKMVEAEVSAALGTVQSALDGYVGFVNVALEGVYSKPDVISAYERRSALRGLGIVIALMLAATGIAIAYWISHRADESKEAVSLNTTSMLQSRVVLVAGQAGATGRDKQIREPRCQCKRSSETWGPDHQGDGNS